MARIATLVVTPQGLRRMTLTNPWLPRSVRTPCLNEPQLHALARLLESTCPPPSGRRMSGQLRSAVKRLHVPDVDQK